MVRGRGLGKCPVRPCGLSTCLTAEYEERRRGGGVNSRGLAPAHNANVEAARFEPSNLIGRAGVVVVMMVFYIQAWQITLSQTVYIYYPLPCLSYLHGFLAQRRGRGDGERGYFLSLALVLA